MSKTFESLVRELLDKVPSNVDKREGSVIYDAIAPCAYFLAQQDFLMDNFLSLVFADTAQGEYLDKAVSMYGIVRKKATAAVRKIVVSDVIDIGTRWGIRGLVYVVTGTLGNNSYEATCETTGEVGNQFSGNLEPLFAVSGITASLGDIILAGTNVESDEALRERFYARVRLPVTSGNIHHYRQWAMEIPGVGDAKVFPLDDGPGTVTVLVVDSQKSVSAGLPEMVKTYIDTVRPIGAVVKVLNPAELNINVRANLLLDGSMSLEQVSTAFEHVLNEYLKDSIFNIYRISHAKLGSLLLDIPGVEDFEGLTLNGETGNIVVGEKQIPVKGTVVLQEVSTLGIN